MSKFDDPWNFTVTWNPECGPLPAPVLRLFRYRSEITPGGAVHRTDQGHANFYVGAVERYITKYEPSRADVAASATLASPDPREHGTGGGDE